MAEFYSKQLRVNIKRGMQYNAEHALSNGYKVFGIKTVNKMLKNRKYIGECQYGDTVIEGGMPSLVNEVTFDKVQDMLAYNKCQGWQRVRGIDEDEAPRYWLTGKLFYGECGGSMQGISDTSKTGSKYYYYYCKEPRFKRYGKKPVRKEWVESVVSGIIKDLLSDSEKLMSLAVDAARYYEEKYKSTNYFERHEAKRKSRESSTKLLRNECRSWSSRERGRRRQSWLRTSDRHCSRTSTASKRIS